MFKWWRDAKIDRLLAKHKSLMARADYYREESSRLALEAYYVPDMMVTPMRWARLQNGSNWARYHEHQHRLAAKQVRQRIQELESSSLP